MIKIDSEIPPPHLLFMKHVLLHLVSASVLKQILKETTVLIKYFRLKFAIISFSILAFGTVWTYFFSTSSLDLQDHTHLWGGGITVVKSVDSTPSLGTSEITTQFLFGSNPIL